MALLYISDAKVFKKLRSLANLLGVALFFFGLILSVMYDSGLLFFGSVFLAWLIAYFLIGYVIVQRPGSDDQD